MDFSFPVREVEEGAARVLVSDVPHRKGPGTAGPWPFYNPTMAVNRDVSAIVVARWPGPLRSVLDGLAATGVWGIRMALEANVADVAFNDRSSLAAELIRENLRRNDLKADVFVGDLSERVRAARYDFVDIDPFGPPTPFLDAAIRFEEEPGLGVTATDTAVLCGTYPEACVRRYRARPLRCNQGSEIGLRILLAYCADLAREQGTAIRPVFSFAAEHFVRAMMVVERAPKAFRIGFVARRNPGEFARAKPDDRDAIGPLWLGPLLDAAVTRSLTPSPWTLPASARLVSTIQGEADLPPFFVTTDELAARERGSPPKLDRFIEALRSLGFRAARTHFHPRGVKMDAPYADVLRAFREPVSSGSTGD